MDEDVRHRLQGEIDEIRRAGLWKDERVIESPQAARIVVGGREVLNFCANNYLGLASDPRLVRAAQEGLARWGLGMASVRFICGTQEIHKELEAAIARFLGTEDAILYTSCFDANGGLFETLLGEPDVFFTTPGYDGWPLVMLVLDKVDVERLTELVTDAWRMRAADDLVDERTDVDND